MKNLKIEDFVKCKNDYDVFVVIAKSDSRLNVQSLYDMGYYLSVKKFYKIGYVPKDMSMSLLEFVELNKEFLEKKNIFDSEGMIKLLIYKLEQYCYVNY